MKFPPTPYIGPRSLMRQFHGLLFLALLTAIPHWGHAAVIVYEESFFNAGPSDASLDSVGWKAHYGSTATAFNTASTNFNTSPTASAPTGFGGVEGGYLFSLPAFSPVTQASIYWTEEAAISSIGGIENVTMATFHLRNNVVDENNRFAIRVGTSWYVTQATYNSPNSVDWAERTVDFSTALWNTLNFTPGSTLSMGGAASLPLSGTVTAVALVDLTGNSRIRMDQLEIYAVPEPTAAVLGLVGAIVLARRGRKSRRSATTPSPV